MAARVSEGPAACLLLLVQGWLACLVAVWRAVFVWVVAVLYAGRLTQGSGSAWRIVVCGVNRLLWV